MSDLAVPPSRRKIEFRSLAVLVITALGVLGSGFFLLYDRMLEARTIQLVEMARAQARLMEAVAKFDAFFQSGEVEGAARSATLSQIKESHRRYTGFGETGEIVLAQHEGSEIVFLLPTRKLDFRIPSPVPFASGSARPMQRALARESGTVVALDFTGNEVLAAYEWLPFLEMGLVCKVDMTEVRAPFVRAALITGAIALVLILGGFFLNSRMVSPLVRRVVKHSEEIQKRETKYRHLVENIPGAVFRSEANMRRTMLEISDPIAEITGRSASVFVNDAKLSYADIVLPDDADIIQRGMEGYLEVGRTYRLEYRILRSDGVTRWVSEYGTVVAGPDGQTLLEGVLFDITERKEAEEALEELPRKLSRYLSPQVYKSIFEGDQDVSVGSSRKKLTVFFSDIVGFTAKSDALDPEDFSYIINSYLNRMAEIAIEHGGTLDKFIGDGVLIFFGDPESRGLEEDACACVRMAIAMQAAVVELNEEITTQGIDAPIAVRMGISTGFCTVGNFGSENRMDYTIMGRFVNLAARLEASADPGEIRISRETSLLVEAEFHPAALQSITAKGFERPIEVFRVGTVV